MDKQEQRRATETTERGEQEVLTHSQMVNGLNSLEVSEYMAFLPWLKKHFLQQIASFEGGRIRKYFSPWQEITTDSEILDMVSGTHIEFQSIPAQTRPKISCKFSPQECATIQTEVSSLTFLKGRSLLKHIMTQGSLSPRLCSSKERRNNPNDLNLQTLNEHVVYLHFKMNTLKDAISLLKPNCFMASIDLKDAYYSVPIAQVHQKYLKFQWKNKLYAFTCFPNGLAFCPRKFTKLLKPVYSVLRHLGHASSPYIDDSYLQGNDYYSCLANVIDTIRLIYYLGFLIHPGKSVLVSTQRLIFLGFILDSVLMRIYMTPDKVAKVIDLCSNLLSAQMPTIRTVSQVLGYIISTFPGVMFGPLYFRHLECDKSLTLIQANRDFDLPMTLSVEAKQELSWWVSSAPHSYNVVSRGQPEVTLTTDDSLVGWGCMLGETRTGGSWSPNEKSKHINYLELLAVYLAFQSLTPQVTGKHVKVMVDNMTALSDINHMGTDKCKDRHQLVTAIWLWCMEHSVWLTAVHILGAENIDADLQSRVFNTNLEWTLNKPIFAAAISKLSVSSNIDLFASRLNFQIQPYVSFHPDPGAIAINAFHMSWKPYLSHIFPPFCLTSRIL